MNAVAFATAFILAGLLPPTPSPLPRGLQVDKPAPAFFVTGLDGKLFGRSTAHGRALVVSIFTTSCVPCRAEIPNLVAAYSHYRNSVTFIGIDEREPNTKVASFVHRMHIPYAVGIDNGSVATTFGASSLPYNAFIDAHGIVRAVSNGPLTRADLAQRMTVIAGG